MATERLSTSTIRKGFLGEIKVLSIVTPAATSNNDTLDLGSDTVGGYINTITNTINQDDDGGDNTAAWDPATGIITLSITTTGIHNVLVFGI